MRLFEYLKNRSDVFYSGGVDENEIISSEQKLEIEFSKEYKEYLSKFGTASVGSHELTGLGLSSRLNVIEVTIEERERNDLKCCSMYIIERIYIDHIVVWQNKKGEIFRSAPGVQPKKIARSIMEYLEDW